MRSKRRVLCVDDDRDYCRLLYRLMLEEGFKPREVHSAAGVEPEVRRFRPHLILVDLHLGRDSGIQVYRKLKAGGATSHIPVVLLTGEDLMDDVLLCVERDLGSGRIYHKLEGAQALIAVAHEALRGKGNPSPPDRGGRLLSRCGVAVDRIARKCWVNGEELPGLSGRRFDLLCAFLRTSSPLSRRDILNLVWENGDNLNVVDVTISRLRKYLSVHPGLSLISTFEGYVLHVD